MKNGLSAYIMSKIVDEKWFGKVVPKWLLRKSLMKGEKMVWQNEKYG